MTRAQRFRYEMFVRVHSVGQDCERSALFRASSKAPEVFARVGAAVALLNELGPQQVLAESEAHRVKPRTWTTVTEMMSVIARTSRRIPEVSPHTTPFHRPPSKSAAAIVAAARRFADEAALREAAFLALGMAPTFVADFRAAIDGLECAAARQRNSGASRRAVQRSIEQAISDGFDAVRTLYVMVVNELRDNPAMLACWRRARQLAGVRRRGRRGSRAGSRSRTAAATDSDRMPATA